MYRQQGASFTPGCYLEIGHAVPCEGTSFIFPGSERPQRWQHPRDFPGPECAEAIEGDTFTSLRDGAILLPVNKCPCAYFSLASEEEIPCARLFQFFILLEAKRDRKSLKIKRRQSEQPYLTPFSAQFTQLLSFPCFINFKPSSECRSPVSKALRHS